MAHAIYTSFINLIDSNGIPYASAKVFVCDAGTTNLKTIYSDAGLSTPATNPVSVSSGGPHDIRYVAAGTYKIIVETGGGDTIGSGTTQSRYCKDNVDTGVAVGSGALPIASGGTSATSAAAARTALSVPSAAEVASIATDVAELQDTLTGTDATQLAAGTTAQRPVSPAVGQIRHNTTTTKLEDYISGGWDNLMHESANATATADVLAETAAATFIRPDRLISSPRVAKALAYVTFSGGTPTMTTNTGFSSTITDHGTGDITVTMSTAMGSTSYYVIATALKSDGNSYPTIVSKTTTAIRLICRDTSGTAVDPDSISIIVLGAL